MAAPRLTTEQRVKLVEWLINDFPESLIHSLFRSHGWEPLASSAITYHRHQHRDEIDARLKERMDAAYDAGLAQREARIRALTAHAEKLESLIWLPDEKGKLHNEKAYRETLDDIAAEMGDRQKNVNLSGSVEVIKRVGADLERI